MGCVLSSLSFVSEPSGSEDFSNRTVMNFSVICWTTWGRRKSRFVGYDTSLCQNAVKVTWVLFYLKSSSVEYDTSLCQNAVKVTWVLSYLKSKLLGYDTFLCQNAVNVTWVLSFCRLCYFLKIAKSKCSQSTKIWRVWFQYI
jgi:hypothetical protein